MAEVSPLNLIVPDNYVGPKLQAAVNQAASSRAAVWIPASYDGSDTYTNPSNVPIYDMRGSGSASFAGASGAITYSFSVSNGVVTATPNPVSGLPSYSGTDAAVVINNALSQMQNTGGTLAFKNGTYNFSSATQENTGSYTHFYCVGIPATGSTSYPQFNFVGESSNFSANVGVLGTGNSNGVIFNVTTAAETAAGAGNTLAAFWMRPSTVAISSGKFWNDSLTFQNISILFPNNQRGKEIGLYCLEASYLSAINVDIEFVTAPSAVSAAGNTAFVSPATFSDGVLFQNCYCQGWEVGFEVDTEHSRCDNTYAFHCTTAYWYGRNQNRNAQSIFHGSSWIHPQSYDCITALRVGTNINSGSLLDIHNFDIEYITSGPWTVGQVAIESPAGISGGTITVTYIQTNVGRAFGASLFSTGSGGQNYVVRELGLRPEGNIINSATSSATTQTTKQTLKSFTVPAQTFLYQSYGFYGSGSTDGGDYIRIRAWGTTAANANRKTFELDYGGTTIASVTSTASSGTILLEAIILTSGGTGNNSQECIGWGTDGTVSNPTRTATSVSTSSSTTIVAAATTPTSSGDFTFRGWTIEYIVGTR